MFTNPHCDSNTPNQRKVEVVRKELFLAKRTESEESHIAVNLTIIIAIWRLKVNGYRPKKTSKKRLVFLWTRHLSLRPLFLEQHVIAYWLVRHCGGV
jgi:hypothetical protein